jgi:SAM-dependent methyltransferase
MPRLLGVSREQWRRRARRLNPAWLGISRQVRPLPLTTQRSISRAYIDRFVEKNCTDIKGHAVEIRDPLYSKRYPEQITALDIVDVDDELEEVTIVADLTDLHNVLSGTFDVAIVTQTLQYIFDVQQAVVELHRVLAPGGVLLMTVPAAEKMRMLGGFEHDCWRFTVRSVRQLLSAFVDVEVESFGNCLAAIGVYRGVPASRLGRRLWLQDPLFPVVVGARALK